MQKEELRMKNQSFPAVWDCMASYGLRKVEGGEK